MEEKEVIELLSKDENFAVARLIAVKYEKVKQKLADDLFNQIKNHIEYKYVDLKSIGKTKISDKNCYLDFKNEKWTDVRLRFQFDGTDFHLFKCCILGDSKNVDVKQKQIDYFLNKMPGKDEHTSASVYRYLVPIDLHELPMPRWHIEKDIILKQVDTMINAINEYFGIKNED